MKRKAHTLVILLVISLMGFLYWLDLQYNIDPVTGLMHQRGVLWIRYVVIGVLVGLSALGMLSVGPHASVTLRLRHPLLGILFMPAALAGFGYGGVQVYLALEKVDWSAPSFAQVNWFSLVLGAAFLWYGVYLVLVGVLLMRQNRPSPTQSALAGVVAVLPLCVQTVYEILVKPTGIYRIGPFVRIFSLFLSIVWFSLLLWGLHVALTRTRARLMYFSGLCVFLFSTCLGLPQAVYQHLYSEISLRNLALAINTGLLGLLTGTLSLTLAGQTEDEAVAKTYEALLAAEQSPETPSLSRKERRLARRAERALLKEESGAEAATAYVEASNDELWQAMEQPSPEAAAPGKVALFPGVEYVPTENEEQFAASPVAASAKQFEEDFSGSRAGGAFAYVPPGEEAVQTDASTDFYAMDAPPKAPFSVGFDVNSPEAVRPTAPIVPVGGWNATSYVPPAPEMGAMPAAQRPLEKMDVGEPAWSQSAYVPPSDGANGGQLPEIFSMLDGGQDSSDTLLDMQMDMQKTVRLTLDEYMSPTMQPPAQPYDEGGQAMYVADADNVAWPPPAKQAKAKKQKRGDAPLPDLLSEQQSPAAPYAPVQPTVAPYGLPSATMPSAVDVAAAAPTQQQRLEQTLDDVRATALAQQILSGAHQPPDPWQVASKRLRTEPDDSQAPYRR